MLRVLITGADGFIARNFLLRINELDGYDVVKYTRSNTPDDLPRLLKNVDVVFHFAAVNRTLDDSQFQTSNVNLTTALALAIKSEVEISHKTVKLIYTSSTQVDYDNAYGVSKMAGERVLANLAEQSSISLYMLRLPNVFGKWCKPNYNSVIATFCHNIANELPIVIHDAEAVISLVYIDDLIDFFLKIIIEKTTPQIEKYYLEVDFKYHATVGNIAEIIYDFHNTREKLQIDRVGSGLVRALYSTYISYLPKNSFTYELKKYSDNRGSFVELMKTRESGQFSFFTSHPGVTRGGHFHNTKVEKFIVVKGNALFRFKNMLTNDYHETFVSDKSPVVVETIPGWTHDIKNVGDSDLIVMLWANEVFDVDKPDTYFAAIS